MEFTEAEKMKKRKINIFYILGVVLIAAAVGLYVARTAAISEAEQKTSEIAEQIENLLPTRTAGIVGEYYEGHMPAYSIDGTDYVGLLQVRNLGIKRPILSKWSKKDVVTHPFKYCGSVYTGNMVIGGSNHKGQMDFLSQLDLGYEVIITDMLGNEFFYKVERIDRATDLDDEQIASDEYSLTLFTYERSEGKYIVVRCEL